MYGVSYAQYPEGTADLQAAATAADLLGDGTEEVDAVKEDEQLACGSC